MSDADLREELAAIELLLSRPALWEPIPAGAFTINPGPSADPRPRFEARRDELRMALSETKVTILDGYRLAVVGKNYENGFAKDGEDPVFFSDFLPDVKDVDAAYDFEISVTVRPHLAPAKKVEGA